MNSMRRLYQLVIILVVVLSLFVSAPPARAAGPGVITINTTEFTSVTNGNCDALEATHLVNGTGPVDACTRAGSTSMDTIHFSISGAGVHTITATFTIVVQNPVIIDGSSQPGYAGSPLIEITTTQPGVLWLQDGSLGGTGTSGSTIKALRITNTYAGISQGYDVLVDADNLIIAGNQFNTDGTALVGTNALGVVLASSASTLIGGSDAADRNYFGGNAGIRIDGGSNNVIQANYFGVQTGGSTALTGTLPMNDDAISIYPYASPSNFNVIRGNVIANYYEGVALRAPTNHNTIVGNYIGIGRDGATRLANGAGIVLYGSNNNTIGGLTAADRNVISGNINYDIQFENNAGTDHSDSNVIEGNYIGTTATGVSGVTPGATDGIVLNDGGSNLIGGSVSGSGNVISGHGIGILVASAATSTFIRGNKIGTDAAGASSIPNLTGISLFNSIADIGDAVIPGQNLISGNSGASGIGILVTGTSGTTIYGNWIGMNAAGSGGLPNGVGISLSNASATIAQNWIGFSNPYDGLYIDVSSKIEGTSSNNCFTGNTRNGVLSTDSGTSAPLSNNWWGSPSGPSGVGAGTGDAVSDYVTYSPYLPAGTSMCPSITGSAGVTGAVLGYVDGAFKSVIAASGGNYSLGVSPGWSGTVTPFKIGYAFSPTSKVYASVTTSQTAQNYAATALSTAGNYDEADSGWSYSGAWATVAITGLFHDSLRIGATVGSTSTFGFWGNGFSLTYLRYTGWGNIGVYLDGSATPLTTINTSGAAGLLTYDSPVLMPGVHTVMFKHAGPAGSFIGYDSLLVRMPAIAGTGAYDFADPSWSYTGSWLQFPAPGLYNNTLNMGLTPGSTTALIFHGTGFSLTYLQYTGWGIIGVFLDGSSTPVTTINTSGTAALPTYTSPTLVLADHMLTLVHLGPAGKYIGVDYVTIVP